MPKGPNFQLPARLNSARGPSRLQPPQGNKSFVRPPSGLMQSWLLAKSGKQSRGESAGAGVDVLWVSPDKWAPRPAGRPGPLSPGRQHQQQKVPQPLGRLGRRPRPRPLAAQPSALPGGPAYLREAACPGEESSQGLRCGRSDLAPSPLARTPLLPPPLPLAARFSLQSPQPHGRPPDPRAPGKSLHRRAAARRRTAPGSAKQP